MQNNCGALPTTPYYDIALANSKGQDFNKYDQPHKWREHIRYLEYFEDTDITPEIEASDNGYIKIVSSSRGFDYYQSMWTEDVFNHLLDVFSLGNVQWIFLGCRTPEKLLVNSQLKKLADDGRIVIHSWVSNLRRVFRQSDIFFHLPKDLGSGTTTLMAIAEKLPIFALDQTDPCNFLPDEAIFQSIDELFGGLKRAIQDASYREQIAETCWRKLENYDVNETTQQVLSAIEESGTEFEKRYLRAV